MATVEKRVACLEGQVDEIIGRQEAPTQFEEVDPLLERIERRFDALDDKLSRQFRWLMGLEITTLIAAITLLARS